MTAAKAFTMYAEGGLAQVPWAATVTYRIDGERLAEFGPEIADRRETWDGCPAKASTYEGRACPVSPLRTIAGIGHDGGEVVYETEAPPFVGCKRYRAADSRAAAKIWMRPNQELRDCFSDFAVTLSLDDSGEVVSVDFMLSGP